MRDNDVLAVALSPQTVHHTTVISIARNHDVSQITAKVKWDDGDDSNSTIILFGLQVTLPPSPCTVRAHPVRYLSNIRHDEPPGCWTPCEHGSDQRFLLLAASSPESPPPTPTILHHGTR